MRSRLQGECNGKVGLFPEGYAQRVDGAAAAPAYDTQADWAAAATDTTSNGYTQPSDAGGAGEDWAVAVYPFEGQEQGDLTFEAGEVIRVTKRDTEWWTGEITADRVGVFPANYTRPAEPHEIVSTFFFAEICITCASAALQMTRERVNLSQVEIDFSCYANVRFLSCFTANSPRLKRHLLQLHNRRPQRM